VALAAIGQADWAQQGTFTGSGSGATNISMQVYTLDPMLDSRWDHFAASHPGASVFHQLGWLKALTSTYGYRPLVLTTTPPAEPLSDGIPFCEINSWITGSRLVSLPFADHCDALLTERGNIFHFVDWLQAESRQRRWKYVELRPPSWQMPANSPLAVSKTFWLHALSLEPPIERLFRALHKNCLQRRIRRAEREQLSYERGSSEEMLNGFYRLLMITRRRHQLLPQPIAWFRNLIASPAPGVEIRLARKNNRPIAAILTLRHGGQVVYKYGCSDEHFHSLAGMPFLFWKLIEESKAEGAEQIDFGRTDLDNQGLIEFKDRFGTRRTRLTYLRYPESARDESVVASYLPAMRRLFSVLPDALSSTAGGLLYRHIG